MSCWGSEAGADSRGRKGGRGKEGAGTPGSCEEDRAPGSEEGGTLQPRVLGPRPGSTWHEVSLEIILVAPPVLGVRCRSNVSWGKSSLNPSPWYPTPTSPSGAPAPTPGLTCRPQCGPEYQRPRNAQTSSNPHPWEASEQPPPSVLAPLSAPPSLLCGTLSLQDFQPASPPYRESSSPNTEAAGN